VHVHLPTLHALRLDRLGMTGQWFFFCHSKGVLMMKIPWKKSPLF
jgi:hypothetical protein